MHVFLMCLLLTVAGTSFADDPLETLNTVEDTVSIMQHTLKAQAPDEGDTALANSLAEPAASDEAAVQEGNIQDPDAR